MLRKIPKLVLILLIVGLSACSQLLIKPDASSKAGKLTFVDLLDEQTFGNQNLISFDVYAEGEVVHAVFAVATNLPKQPYIGYLRSEDAGMHWSKPIEISKYAAATVESGAGNDVQIAAFGNTLMAIWQITGELPGMGPLQVIYSQDGGKSWSRGINPTESVTDQSHPDLVADKTGRFHLVWLDDRDENGHQGVRYARSSNVGQHWELAQTVDESSCSCCWNRLLIGSGGEVNALYRDMEPRDMALAQSFDAGKTWQRTSTVGEFNWIFDGCPHNGGALTWGGSETLHGLVWTGVDNKAGLYYLHSTNNGKSWSMPQAMGEGTLAFHSDIVAIDDKHLLAIWDARGAEGSTVMISESYDNGEHWSIARLISTPESSATFPRIVATQAGVLAMWAEQKPGAVKQWVAAILK